MHWKGVLLHAWEEESFDMLGKQDILIIRIFSLLKIVHAKTSMYQNGAEFLKLN